MFAKNPACDEASFIIINNHVIIVVFMILIIKDGSCKKNYQRGLYLSTITKQTGGFFTTMNSRSLQFYLLFIK